MRGQGGQDHGRFSSRIAEIIQQQHPEMRAAVTMDQHADIVILGDEDPPLCNRFGEQGLVAGIGQPLSDVRDIVAGGAQRSHGGRHDVRIGEQAHLFGGDREPLGRRDLAQPGGVE